MVNHPNRSKAKASDVDALGNRTLYLILVRWPGERDLFTTESVVLDSRAGAIIALGEYEGAECVFEIAYDVPRRDVSEDLALEWLDKLIKGGWEDDAPLPPFIRLHLTDAQTSERTQT